MIDKYTDRICNIEYIIIKIIIIKHKKSSNLYLIINNIDGLEVI